jgi:hypothetical protein
VGAVTARDAPDEGPPFSLDVRSIALFRALLGALILADLAYRVLDLRAFYTDAGIYPRSLGGDAWFSLHALSGQLGWQVVLVAAEAASAVCVVLGYRTRAALVGCWLLAASINRRDPWILQLSDVVLVLWIVYALLLPCAERFTVDLARWNPARYRVRSVATVLVTLQIVAIYEIAALYKAGTETWRHGALLIEALRIDPVATDLGRRVLAYPLLLRLATWATLAWEFLGPVAALLSWRIGWLRCAVCFAFIGFHLFGIGLLMNLGMVAYTLAIAWVLLLPSWFWDVGLPRLGVARFARPRPWRPSEAFPPWPRWAVVTAVGVWLLSWWPRGLPAEWPLPEAPRALATALRVAGVAQEKYSLWTDPAGSRKWAFAARLRDGSQVDLHTGAALDWSALAPPRNNHWYKCFQKMLKWPDVASMVALYAVEQWNARQPPERQVEDVSIVVVWDEKMPAAWWLEQTSPATAEMGSRRFTLAAFDVTDRDGRAVLHPLSPDREAR